MEKALQKKLALVIADDDPDDQYMMQKAIWELNLNHKITAVYNGIQLIDYLQKTGMYKNSSEEKPDCIFLDLNMPLLNGTEAIKRIKRKEELRDIPVFILSTSKSSHERQNLLTLGAHGFYTKSNEYQGLKNMIYEIVEEVYKVNGNLNNSQS